MCHVECSDGSKYTLYAVVRGNLVEINENLLTHPELLSSKVGILFLRWKFLDSHFLKLMCDFSLVQPDTEGYVAILITSLKEHKAQVDSLLSREEYLAAIQRRHENASSQQKKKVFKDSAKNGESDSINENSTSSDDDVSRNGTIKGNECDEVAQMETLPDSEVKELGNEGPSQAKKIKLDSEEKSVS